MALRRYEILDTLPELSFDDLTHLAAQVCNAPIAFIGFIDTDRQWFKSRVGLTIQEVPRYISFCAHAIVEPDVCVIRDALADERFANNPLVTSEPHIRFYAGAQLVTSEGHMIGTICVIDHVPRDLSAEQAEALRVLARQVIAQLDLRRKAADLERAISTRERGEAEIRFQATLIDAVEQAVIATDLDGNIIYWNRFAEKMYGWPVADVLGHNIIKVISAQISQGEAAELLSRLQQGESWSGEFVLQRRDSSTFPALVTDSPIYDSSGALVGIVGVAKDITERKQAEAALREAHGELERRVAQRTAELVAANTLLKDEIAERRRTEESWRESEERLRLLVEQIPAVLWSTDTELRFTSSTGKGLAALQLQPGQVVEMSLSEFFQTDDPLYPPLAAHAQTLHGESLSYEVELEGNIFYAYNEPLRDREGKIIGVIGVALDITERKKMEEALRESEELTRLLIESLKEYAIIMLDTDGRITSWNAGAARLKGYRADEIIGQHFSICCTPEDCTRGKPKHYLKSAALEGRFEDECWQVRKDGSWFWANILITALRDEEGVLRGFAEIIRDITERKRAEDALNAQREFLHQITDVNPHALFVKNGDEQFVLANKATAKLYGTTVENLIGKTETDFPLDEETVERFHLQNREVRETGRKLFIPAESVFDSRTGEIRWFETIKVPLFAPDGTFDQVLGIATEITERVRAEESLHLFESAIEQSNEAITITTPELDSPGPRIIFVNPAFTRMTGYTAEEVIGQTPRILQGPKTDRSVLDELREKLARGEVFEGMVINYRKDGSEFYMEWRVDPISNERGEFTHFVAVQRDVTERVRAKEARMQLQRQLIAAQEEERRRLSRELHDQIGQYLPALMLGLKVLKETGLAQPIHATQVDQLLETATRIAHDVQNLARELRPAALDEFGLAEALKSYAEEWSQRHGIAVDFHHTGFDGDVRLPPHVETTLYRIAQEAFTNILKHAEAQDVSLILERKRRGVKMIVEDDGQGFDVEALMKAPLAERGLGLLGMRERVTLVGGSLEIESAPGAGTTLVVNLPVPAKEGEDAP